MGVVLQRVEPLHRPSPEINEIRDQRVDLGEGHGHCQDGSLVHGPSQVVMQAKSHWQDLAAPFESSAHSSYQLATGSKPKVRQFMFLFP